MIITFLIKLVGFICFTGGIVALFKTLLHYGDKCNKEAEQEVIDIQGKQKPNKE